MLDPTPPTAGAGTNFVQIGEKAAIVAGMARACDMALAPSGLGPMRRTGAAASSVQVMSDIAKS